MAKRLVESITMLKSDFAQIVDVEEFLDMYRSLEYAGLVQNLLVRLAGGVDQESVRYTYIVYSEALEDVLINTNGQPYDAGIPATTASISDSLLNVDFPRFNEIRFYYNECYEDKLRVDVELNYPAMYDQGLAFYIDIREFELDQDNDRMKTDVIIFPDISSDGTPMNFRFTLDLPDEFSWDDRHNVYLKIINSNGLSLSRETKSFMQSKFLFLKRVEDRVEEIRAD